jgi:hypothetical protein
MEAAKQRILTIVFGSSGGRALSPRHAVLPGGDTTPSLARGEVLWGGGRTYTRHTFRLFDIFTDLIKSNQPSERWVLTPPGKYPETMGNSRGGERMSRSGLVPSGARDHRSGKWGGMGTVTFEPDQTSSIPVNITLTIPRPRHGT